MTTEQPQKTVILAEKVLQRTCITHFDDVILTDENGRGEAYFDPYNNWNHTHMVLEKVMEDGKLWERFYKHFVWVCDARGTIRDYMKATKQELMDEVYNLLTNS